MKIKKEKTFTVYADAKDDEDPLVVKTSKIQLKSGNGLPFTNKDPCHVKGKSQTSNKLTAMNPRGSVKTFTDGSTKEGNSVGKIVISYSRGNECYLRDRS